LASLALNFPIEVESIVEAQVRSILESSLSSPHHRIIIVSKLIDALESDATWVEMYGITGELMVPDSLKEEGEIGELLEKARKVGAYMQGLFFCQLITVVLAFS
jgi:hypothetical protein